MLQTKLEFRQTQSLVVTPQLQQAIKLLQLSNLDLVTFLEREIEQNPLLDWEDAPEPGVSEPGGEAINDAKVGAAPETGASELNGHDDVRQSLEDKASSTSEDSVDYADEAHVTPSTGFETLSLRTSGSGQSDGYQDRLEDLTAQQTTLRDHLRQQLHIVVTDPAMRLVGDHLIDLIDDAGYLKGSIEEIAARLSAPLSNVEEVLHKIQSFEPVGVGSRSLAECLALQLKELNRFDPAIEALLNHLNLLANHEFTALQRICGVDREDLADMIAEIRALNPRPGLEFISAPVECVIPDILVSRDRSGAWNVQLNSDTLPRICVNHGFYAAAKRMVHSEKDKSFLQGCMATANWLTRSLEQRRRTMLKVATEIVRQQAMFLERGVRGLKPLALKDVAERIAMHESTVSRVTSGKYMQTPRGTFELKYFFTSSIPSADNGDAHSSEAVKHRIKELIDNESSRRILSDDKIVAMLHDEGIDIARRTVAKYREAMRIPSSVQRRRIRNSSGRPLAEEATR